MARTVMPAFDPFEYASKVVSVKYALPIVWALVKEPSGAGFNMVLHSVPGLTPRTLSNRLKGLEKFQLIQKNVTLSPPIRIRYLLTDKGKELAQAAGSLAEWGKKFGE
jgi:DNA-binding HxlR family transcriptional regulator